MAKQRLPGIAVAVVKDGKVVKAEAYGLADLESRVPAKVDTVFRIQSVTKQFTATGVMMLVEDGKIGLDDTVKRYLDGSSGLGQNHSSPPAYANLWPQRLHQ
jgi:D-alanyl-D-alanine carboxypeptidase